MKGIKVLRVAMIVFLTLAFGTGAVAQQQQQRQAQPAQYRHEPAPLTLEKIAEGVYQVKGGSGANAGVIIGREEIMVIDAKMSEESAQQMLTGIKKISDVPITVLVLTHSDGDHVNGITAFPSDIKIIAHAETKRDMDEAFKDEAQRAYLPRIKTFDTKSIEYDPGDRKVRLLYFGPAHTSGDIVVYVPDAKVAFLGDLYFAGRDPLVHRHKNGNSFGLVNVLQSALALDAETFLSGHAEAATRADVEGMLRALQEKQDKVKAMVGEGKSLAEILESFGLKETPPAPPGRTRFMNLVEVIYLELTAK
ncbi:MAG: MBL fold metallo-hydrolase [Candidatus Aminicenantes bacterium]|nr:MBL fold metallo-hydrolase [Candidatus Aminicenantes bacterium]